MLCSNCSASSANLQRSEKIAPGKLFCDTKCLREFVGARVSQSGAREEALRKRGVPPKRGNGGTGKVTSLDTRKRSALGKTVQIPGGGPIRATPSVSTNQKKKKKASLFNIDTLKLEDLPVWLQDGLKNKSATEKGYILSYLKEASKKMQLQLAVDIAKARQPPKSLVNRVERDFASIPQWFKRANTQLSSQGAVEYGNVAVLELQALSDEYTKLLYSVQRGNKTSKSEGTQMLEWLQKMGAKEKEIIEKLRGKQEYSRLKEMRTDQLVGEAVSTMIDQAAREVSHLQAIGVIDVSLAQAENQTRAMDTSAEPVLGKRETGRFAPGPSRVPAAAVPFSERVGGRRQRVQQEIDMFTGLPVDGEDELVGAPGDQEPEPTQDPALIATIEFLETEQIITKDMSQYIRESIAQNYLIANSVVEAGHQDQISKGVIPEGTPSKDGVFRRLFQRISLSKDSIKVAAAAGGAGAVAYITSSLYKQLTSLVAISISRVSQLIPVTNEQVVVDVATQMTTSPSSIIENATLAALEGRSIVGASAQLITSLNDNFSAILDNAASRLPLIMVASGQDDVSAADLIRFGRETLLPAAEDLSAPDQFGKFLERNGAFGTSEEALKLGSSLFKMIKTKLSPEFNVVEASGVAIDVPEKSAEIVRQALLDLRNLGKAFVSFGARVSPKEMETMSDAITMGLEKLAVGENSEFLNQNLVTTLSSGLIDRLEEGIVQGRAVEFTNAFANYTSSLVLPGFAYTLDYLGVFQWLAIVESGIRGVVYGTRMPDLVLSAPYSFINTSVQYSVYNMGLTGLMGLAGGALLTAYVARLDPVDRAFRRFFFSQPDAPLEDDEQVVSAINNMRPIRRSLAGRFTGTMGTVARTLSSVVVGTAAARVASDVFYYAYSETSLFSLALGIPATMIVGGLAVGIAKGLALNFFGQQENLGTSPSDTVRNVMQDLRSMLGDKGEQQQIASFPQESGDLLQEVGFDFSTLSSIASFASSYLTLSAVESAVKTSATVVSILGALATLYNGVQPLGENLPTLTREEALAAGVQAGGFWTKTNTRRTMSFLMRSFAYPFIQISRLVLNTTLRSISLGEWIHKNPTKTMMGISAVAMAASLGMYVTGIGGGPSLEVQFSNPTALSDLLPDIKFAFDTLSQEIVGIGKKGALLQINDASHQVLEEKVAAIVNGIANFTAMINK